MLHQQTIRTPQATAAGCTLPTVPKEYSVGKDARQLPTLTRGVTCQQPDKLIKTTMKRATEKSVENPLPFEGLTLVAGDIIGMDVAITTSYALPAPNNRYKQSYKDELGVNWRGGSQGHAETLNTLMFVPCALSDAAPLLWQTIKEYQK